MIYKSNPDPALFLGNAFERLHSEKFSVCYRGQSLSFFSDKVLLPGFLYDNLTSGVYGEYVQWEYGENVLDVFFNDSYINTIILGNCGYDFMSIKIKYYNDVLLDSRYPRWLASDGSNIITHLPSGQSRPNRIVFNNGDGSELRDISRKLAPEASGLDPTDQNACLILLPGNIFANTVQFVFSGGEPTMSKIWIGNRDEFLLPSTISYPMKTNSIGGLTDLGTLYGKKFHLSRGIKIKWDVMDDPHRRKLEDYMGAVQTCTAHWILPFKREWDQCYMPPAFVRLKTAQLDEKKIQRGWVWDGSDLEWEVLR